MEQNYLTVETYSENKKVSNWDKPGGTLGKIVAGLSIGGGLMLLYKALPFLITLATNAITLGLLVGVLGLMVYLIQSKKFRNLFSMVYFQIMRKLTGLVIEINPIAIAERYLQELKEKMKTITRQLGEISGLVRMNSKKLDQKKEELEKNILMFKKYQNLGMSENAEVIARQICRLKNSVKRTSERLEESKKWLEILKTLKTKASLVVEDTENEVADKKEEYEMVSKQYCAFKSIMSIIKGDSEKFENFTYAMDTMTNTIYSYIGEMDMIINESNNVIDKMKVESSVVSEKTKQIIDKFDEGGIDAIFNPRKALSDKSECTTKILEKELNKVMVKA